MVQERLPYVDIAKGIAIWLMIVGHQHISEQAHTYISSFHMPLFFFISGMFFRKNKSFFQNLESAIRGLVIPYLFFSTIGLAICWISPYVHPELYFNMTWMNIFSSAFNGIFIGTTQVTPTSFLPIAPLWFLLALFDIRVLCSAISSITKNEYLWATICIIVSITMYHLLTTNVYSLRSGMMATPFYVAGFFMRKIDFTLVKYKLLIFVLLLSYFFFITPLNGRCESVFGIYGKWMVIYYINAIVGTLMVILLSTYLTCKKSYLQKIGCNTLVILGTHLFFTRPIQIISVYLFGNNCMSSIIYILVVPIIAIICCLYINRYIIKYIPFAVGKR